MVLWSEQSCCSFFFDSVEMGAKDSSSRAVSRRVKGEESRVKGEESRVKGEGVRRRVARWFQQEAALRGLKRVT